MSAENTPSNITFNVTTNGDYLHETRTDLKWYGQYTAGWYWIKGHQLNFIPTEKLAIFTVNLYNEDEGREFAQMCAEIQPDTQCEITLLFDGPIDDVLKALKSESNHTYGNYFHDVESIRVVKKWEDFKTDHKFSESEEKQLQKLFERYSHAIIYSGDSIDGNTVFCFTSEFENILKELETVAVYIRENDVTQHHI